MRRQVLKAFEFGAEARSWRYVWKSQKVCNAVTTGGHGHRSGSRDPTRSAPLTDSSHRSMMNSSSAMDSLSMLIRRWHSLRVAGLVSWCCYAWHGRRRRREGGNILREEELELLVGKRAQLRAEHVVDPDMVSVPPAGTVSGEVDDGRRGGCGEATLTPNRPRQAMGRC